MFWSQACTPSQNQRRQPCILVSESLKLLRLSYNSQGPHHQHLHWKSRLWQYTTSICQISGTEGKEEESHTDLCNVLGSSSYPTPVFIASKQSQHFPTCTAERSCQARGELTALVHPSFPFDQPERGITERRLIRIWCLTKTVIRSICSPVFYRTLKCFEALFSPSLFSPFPGPFAQYLFRCCPRHFSLLTTTLQTEQASKSAQSRPNPCKAGPYPGANCEKQTSWVILHEFQWALSISLGVIFNRCLFWTSLCDLCQIMGFHT